MGVDDALGPAGGARRVEPECRVLGVGHKRRRVRLNPRQRLAPSRNARRCATSNHDAPFARQGLNEARQSSGKHILDDRQPSAAVGAHEAVVVLGELAVEGDRDGAAPQATEPRGGKVRRVAHQQQHAVARLDAERRESARSTFDLCREFGVGHHVCAADQGCPLSVACERPRP